MLNWSQLLENSRIWIAGTTPVKCTFKSRPLLACFRSKDQQNLHEHHRRTLSENHNRAITAVLGPVDNINISSTCWKLGQVRQLFSRFQDFPKEPSVFFLEKNVTTALRFCCRVAELRIFLSRLIREVCTMHVVLWKGGMATDGGDSWFVCCITKVGCHKSKEGEKMGKKGLSLGNPCGFCAQIARGWGIVCNFVGTDKEDSSRRFPAGTF